VVFLPASRQTTDKLFCLVFLPLFSKIIAFGIIFYAKHFTGMQKYPGGIYFLTNRLNCIKYVPSGTLILQSEIHSDVGIKSNYRQFCKIIAAN